MKFYPIKNKNLIISAIIVVVLFLAGTFYDLNISLSLVDTQNRYCLVLAGFGQFPAYIMLLWVSFMLNRVIKVGCKWKKSYRLITIISLLFATIMSIRDPSHYIGGNHGIALSILGVSLTYSVAFVLYLLVRDSELEKLEKLALCVFAVVCCSQLSIHGLKMIFHRPRMRLIIKENLNLNLFVSWYKFGNQAVRKSLESQGVLADEFLSFPSGHSGASCLIFLMTLMPYCNEKLLKKENIIYWSCFAIWFMVASSRVILGAHFVSDVTMGYIITFAWLLICNRFILHRK